MKIYKKGPQKQINRQTRELSPEKAIIEETIKHNIAHMTSANKAYILGIFGTIIK